jgi:hypothetical protein
VIDDVVLVVVLGSGAVVNPVGFASLKKELSKNGGFKILPNGKPEKELSKNGGFKILRNGK